jgi:hypothetical protein
MTLCAGDIEIQTVFLVFVATLEGSNPLLHSQFGMKARVGIGRLKRRFAIQNGIFIGYTSQHSHYKHQHRHYASADVFADSFLAASGDCFPV